MGGLVYGGQGVSPTLRGQPTNVYDLEAGQTMLIPAGNWGTQTGLYSCVQQYDPIAGIWRGIGNPGTGATHIKVESDGVNWRFANQSGCVVGALVSAGGSGYLTPPTVTAASGSAVFQAIIGGLVGMTPTVTNGGSNYVYPPAVQFAAPPPGGVQATGYATISGGAVTSITINDQGAGYASAPVITLVNDPRDTTGYGAAATCVLTGAGVVSAIVVIDHGNPVTTLPALTISGGSGTGASATAIMNWAITAYTVTTAGSGYSGAVEISGLGGFTATAASYTNPTIQSSLVRGRRASILAALSAGALTATGQTVYDGGVYPGVPSGVIMGGQPGAGPVTGVIGFSMGGVNDVVQLFPA